MKKLLLSAAVIFGFLIYSAYEKNQDAVSHATANSAPYVPPKVSGSSSRQTTATASSQPTVTGKYKDGTYTGSVTDAFYGNVQVQAVIQGGKINSVTFLQYPNDRRTSTMINSQATPLLASEAVQAQGTNVDVVSGATDTSNAFIQSLNSALSQAR